MMVQTHRTTLLHQLAALRFVPAETLQEEGYGNIAILELDFWTPKGDFVWWLFLGNGAVDS